MLLQSFYLRPKQGYLKKKGIRYILNYITTAHQIICHAESEFCYHFLQQYMPEIQPIPQTTYHKCKITFWTSSIFLILDNIQFKSKEKKSRNFFLKMQIFNHCKIFNHILRTTGVVSVQQNYKSHTKIIKRIKNNMNSLLLEYQKSIYYLTSGVTSRGANPVPPVVNIKLSSFSSHQSIRVS